MHGRYLLRMFFFWLLFCNVLDVSLAAQATQIPRVSNFVILLDPTPSMFERTDASEASKTVEAKLILRRMSDLIPEIGYAVVVALPASRRLIGPMAYKREPFRKMVSTLPEKLSDTQKKQKPSLSRALLQSRSVLSKLNDKTSVIILSDGQTNQGAGSIEAARQLMIEAPGTCLDIISLADSAQGRTGLLELADIGNGTYAEGRQLLASRAAMQQFVQNTFYLHLPPKPSRKDLAKLDLQPGARPSPGGSEWPPFEIILFDPRSHSIKQTEMPYLLINAVILKSMPKLHIQVAGHTDVTGKKSDNRRLSLRRAQAVAAELIRHGIQADRISVVGYGESKPVLSNLTAVGRMLNRRVDFVVKEK